MPVLIILAVLWAVVLVPPLLRSRSQRSADSIVDFNYKLDVLGRTNGNRRPAPPADAPTPRPRPARRVPPDAPVPRAGAARRHRCRSSASQRSAKRRRDVLRVLAVAIVVTLLLALVTHSAVAWALQIAGRPARRRVPRVVGVGAQRAGRAASTRCATCPSCACPSSRCVAPQRVLVAAAVDRRAEIGAIGDRARETFEEKHRAREVTIGASRQAIQACAASIRATHRGEYDAAEKLAREARDHVAHRRRRARRPPRRPHAAGRCTTPRRSWPRRGARSRWCATTRCRRPRSIGVDVAPYCNGLAEAASELRRQLLDRLRAGELDRAEELMSAMDEIYSLLVTIDYPDGVTGGLRRTTDALRAVLERTRGDLTTAMVAARLQGCDRAAGVGADVASRVQLIGRSAGRGACRRRPAACRACRPMSGAAK